MTVLYHSFSIILYNARNVGLKHTIIIVKEMFNFRTLALQGHDETSILVWLRKKVLFRYFLKLSFFRCFFRIFCSLITNNSASE